MGSIHLELWFWLFIIGIILFIASLIGYELSTIPDVPVWVWVLMSISLFLILIFVYIYKQRDCYNSVNPYYNNIRMDKINNPGSDLTYNPKAFKGPVDGLEPLSSYDRLPSSNLSNDL